jgi:hypothetical protein
MNTNLSNDAGDTWSAVADGLDLVITHTRGGQDRVTRRAFPDITALKRYSMRATMAMAGAGFFPFNPLKSKLRAEHADLLATLSAGPTPGPALVDLMAFWDSPLCYQGHAAMREANAEVFLGVLSRTPRGRDALVRMCTASPDHRGSGLTVALFGRSPRTLETLHLHALDNAILSQLTEAQSLLLLGGPNEAPQQLLRMGLRELLQSAGWADAHLGLPAEHPVWSVEGTLQDQLAALSQVFSDSVARRPQPDGVLAEFLEALRTHVGLVELELAEG